VLSASGSRLGEIVASTGASEQDVRAALKRLRRVAARARASRDVLDE
jgi:DNA-binding transcriptional regulator PaaX